MSHPREILNRVRRQRIRRDMTGAPVVPAPTAPASPTQSAAPVAPVAPVAPAPRVSQPVPRPVGGHALYSEVMRSHDRMGTRHLKP